MRHDGPCIAIAAYLDPYGYSAEAPAADSKGHRWRVLPGSGGSSPSLSLTVEGHTEVDKHTLYKVRCRIEGGQGLIVWNTSHRLVQIREGLYHPAVAGLASYSKLFSQTPFARHGGPRGTTARLVKWLGRLAECVNQGAIHPELLALVLSFFQAPAQRDHVEEFSVAPAFELVSHEDQEHHPAFGRPLRSLDEGQAHVQRLYYEELRKRFEFESAERCFSLQCRGAPGRKILLEVICCLVENLDDHWIRMEARSSVWDENQQRLVPLDGRRREQLQRDLTDHLEPALLRALTGAAVAACEEDGPCGRSLLANRRTSLENDCNELLAQKTLALEEYQDLEEEIAQRDTSACTGDEISSASSRSSFTPKAPSAKKRGSIFRRLARPRK